MVLFFVNGSLKIIKYDYLPENNSIDFYEYKMRFLTETTKATYIRMTMIDDYNNKLEFEELVNGLNLLEFDCTPFIEKYNHRRLSYIRIKYQVSVDGEDYIVHGSFPIISHIHEEALKIACVSCNNNKRANDDGNYNYQNICSKNLWETVADQNADIILHTGNQIYGDYIYNENIGKNYDGSYDNDKIYEAYANLYRTAYSEEEQGRAMRNSINLMVLEGNDIYESFGSKGSNVTKDNNHFKSYYFGGMKAFLNYQYQLHSDMRDEMETDEIDGYESLILLVDDFSDILLGNSNIYYHINYGRYTFICLDQRHGLYHSGMVMAPHQLSWLKMVLTQSENKDIIIVSPRPIGDISRTAAKVYGYLSSYGKDNLMHPDNFNQTKEFMNILNDFKDKKDIKIISGYVRKTYTNTITNNGLVAKQLVTGPITRIPLENESLSKRIVNWFVKKVNRFNVDNFVIEPKENLSSGNNFGIINENELINENVESFKDLYYLGTI